MRFPILLPQKHWPIDGLTEGDAVNLYVYPSRQADVTVSWTDDQGLKKTNQQTLESNRVSVIDLGSVPKSRPDLPSAPASRYPSPRRSPMMAMMTRLISPWSTLQCR